MKTKIIFLLMLALSLLFSGCSVGVPLDEYNALQEEYDALQNEYNALRDEYDALSAEVDALKNQIAEPAPPPEADNQVESTFNADSPAAEEKPKGDIGTRKNPATFGQTVLCSTYSHEMEVTLLEVIRGDEAKSIAKKANRFNEYDEDVDLIIAKFKIKVTKDLTGEDREYLASASSFDYADNSYAKEFALASVAGYDDELFVQLYEGSEAEGYVFFEGKFNQEQDYLVFEDDYWFDLAVQ